MRKLAIIAFIIAILAIIVGVVTSLTTNASITNDVAIEQLNGGDEEYLAMQAHNQYREVAYTISGCVTVAAVTVMLLALYKIQTKNNHK